LGVGVSKPPIPIPGGAVGGKPPGVVMMITVGEGVHVGAGVQVGPTVHVGGIGKGVHVGSGVQVGSGVLVGVGVSGCGVLMVRTVAPLVAVVR
jgi:UDP-3-O-[3-hydroxymyristoyl] glucosamine N-acyltransferase